MTSIKRIAIFASGNGSNAENIFNYFKGNNDVEVVSFFSNKKNAFVLQRAEKLKIQSFYFPNSEFRNGEEIITKLKSQDIDLIVLAGFLLMIPKNIITAFPDKILNIHPALLPKYGGKGMYGDNVHKAVKSAGELESGITIHLVNEHYDMGEHIFQIKCKIQENDSYIDIADKVHSLEYKYFPEVIADFIKNLK